MMKVDAKRVRKVNNLEYLGGNVAYLMSRDQRADDNWALKYAQELAMKSKSKLLVVFNLLEQFMNAQSFHFNFMFSGLIETSAKLSDFNIPLHLTKGRNLDNLIKFLIDNQVSALVLDFDPLKIKQNIKNELASKINIPIFEVDAHNIVPVWIASEKQEFGAYTIRPKINRLLDNYLTEIPALEYHFPNIELNFEELSNNLKLEFQKFNSKNKYFESGSNCAFKRLNQFVNNELDNYSEKRNFPELNLQSGLSPYIHFGQISAQKIAFMAKHSNKNKESVDSFLEELIVRRELSDNFCYYNKNYDNFDGFHSWAQKTLNEHRNDKRTYSYSLDIFENANTHDKYWNAAQKQMILTGKMHGYMRMYWAKKILEWTENPEQAMDIAIYLNDKYQLDGRDPNGYTGIAWSIGGVHDRAWNERTIFGKIRYMNADGLKRKFKIDEYVKQINSLSTNSMF